MIMNPNELLLKCINYFKRNILSSPFRRNQKLLYKEHAIRSANFDKFTILNWVLV